MIGVAKGIGASGGAAPPSWAESGASEICGATEHGENEEPCQQSGASVFTLDGDNTNGLGCKRIVDGSNSAAPGEIGV